MDGECMFAQNVTVRVEDFVCGNPTIYIPNAFTPNVDGKNEKLYVRGNNLISLNFYVYDRWGELVFESHSVNDGWDGTFEGRPVDPDVYVYYFDGVCEGGAKYIEKGNITLIR
jgi:gliding motility-associated-like protein